MSAMNRRHIVMATRVVPQHSPGGMQAVAWELAREFAQRGIRVTVLTTRIPGRPTSFVEEGVEVIAFADAPVERYSTAWWKASAKYFETRLLSSVTGVLSVSAGGYGLLPLKSRLPHVPFVLQVHGTSLGEALSKWRTRSPRSIIASARNLFWLVKDIRTYARFDAVIAVGRRVYKDLCSPPISWFLPSQNVHLIHNGVDSRVFSPRHNERRRLRERFGWTERQFIAITVSRLHPQKGIHHSLQGFARFAREDSRARYIIAGDGPSKTELELLVRRLGIGDRVVFTGAVPRDQVHQFLQMSDVFLMTSTRVEVGLPLNLLEALAVGIPVIVSQHLVEGEDLGPGVISVDPNQHGEIAAALSRVAKGADGKRTWKLPDRLTLDYAVAEYIRLFERLRGVTRKTTD